MPQTQIFIKSGADVSLWTHLPNIEYTFLLIKIPKFRWRGNKFFELLFYQVAPGKCWHQLWGIRENIKFKFINPIQLPSLRYIIRAEEKHLLSQSSGTNKLI